MFLSADGVGNPKRIKRCCGTFKEPPDASDLKQHTGRSSVFNNPVLNVIAAGNSMIHTCVSQCRPCREPKCIKRRGGTFKEPPDASDLQQHA